MKKTIYTMLASVTLTLAACNGQSVAEKTPVKKEIGVQLYSVRELIGNPERFAQNQATVLPQLAQMGYTAIETANYNDGKLYGMTPEDFKACIEKAGLKVLSTHTTRGLSAEELKAGAPSEETMKWWDECIAAHKAAGMKYIVTPSQRFPETMKDLQTWCDYHNAIGKKCTEAGLKYGYHNHSFELKKVEDKAVMLEYMIENTDPQHVFFEMDVYWMMMGQASPVDFFNKYPGRFKLLHIKDRKEIGQSGMVGFDAIFKNAELAGVENIVVEVEGLKGEALMPGMVQSAEYLLKADFVEPSYTK